MKLLAAVMLVAVSATTALAQPAPQKTDGDSLAAQDCARARKLGKQCVLTFGSEDITGNLVAPDGTGIAAREMTTFASLIHLRADFRAEIIAAADWI